MQRECGDINFPIWLLGDSEPKNWADVLFEPFDERHPIRHNIWTVIADMIQEIVFNANKQRIDFSRIYIRNAVDDPKNKPKPSESDWNSFDKLKNDLMQFNEMIIKYKPKMILSFGAFSYEFARRSINEQCDQYSIKHWGAENLGKEFRLQIQNPKYLVFPLLHRSIAGGKFIQSHNKFCNAKEANYFRYVSIELAKIILKLENIYIKV